MGASIEEEVAWELVLALPRAIGEGRSPVRVAVPVRAGVEGEREIWLQVHASGRWETSGAVRNPARDLLEMFLPLLLPAELVVGQLGQSLDGRIATESGDSHFVTGPADIRRLHRLRALVDAVIVGAETIARDDPRLTVRAVAGENPVRVVLDPDTRLDPTRHVFADGAARTLVVRRAGGHAHGSVEGEVVSVPAAGPEGFDPHDVLRALRNQGLARVLVEGGGITVSRFLEAGLLDRLHVTVAPLLIGSGRPALTLAPIEALSEARRPRCRHFRLGEDILFDLDLRSG